MKQNDLLITPEYIYLALGTIDLDPCAGISTNIGKTNYVVEKGQDGLQLDWFGFVFCNPPFSKKEIWIKKMMEHRKGILLLPERGSTPWFGPLAKACGYYFVMGKKINFIGGPSSNPIGTVLFPFGNEAVKRIFNSGLPGHLNHVLFFNERKKHQKTNFM